MPPGLDGHKNYSYSVVATAPSPAASGTSLVVAAGHGVRFPTAPFAATVWPAGVQPKPANAEIVLVTAVATDTFTITRAQESSSARTIIVGDQIIAKAVRTIGSGTYTDEQAQDAIGAMLLDTASIDLVYVDATPSLSATVLPAGVSHASLANLTTGDPHTQYLLETLIDAKGDLLAGSAADTAARLAAGTNDQVLTADSAQATGLKWTTPLSVSNPYKFRVSMNAAANTGNGAFAVIPFDTEQYDSNNNVASGVFTAPVAGFYWFAASVNIGAQTSDILIVSLFKNGSEISRGAQIIAPAVGNTKVVATDQLQLAANDTVDVRAYATATRPLVVGSTIQDYFAGHLVSLT